MASRRYLLVSPCRDEAEYLQITIDSVARQTVTPTTWLIVDDGSKDDTPKILAAAAEKYPFIKVVRRTDRGHRLVGPGVIDAFYFGLSQVDTSEYDYLCKFDCDLEMPPRYFERVMEYFEEDPWLGTMSGKLYLRENGKLHHERTGDENSVGPVKFYRTSCFADIGGFVREVCWDGIDGHMCRLRGWIARSKDDPELRIVHLRQMGTSHIGLWTGRVRWGRGKYFMGSTLPYMLAVSAYRMAEKPYFVSGLGILWGYVQSRAASKPRLDDAAYLESLKHFERNSLIFGKGRATAKLDASIRRNPPPHARDRKP